MKNLFVIFFLLVFNISNAQELISEVIFLRDFKKGDQVQCSNEQMNILLDYKAINDKKTSTKKKVLEINDVKYNMVFVNDVINIYSPDGAVQLNTNADRFEVYTPDNKRFKKRSKLWLSKKIEYYNEQGDLVLTGKLRNRHIYIETEYGMADKHTDFLAALCFEEMLRYAKVFYGIGGNI